MPLPAKLLLILGGIAVFLAVAMGAFGAHGLKKILAPELMATYETAVQYHFYHALGLLVVGLSVLHWPSATLLRWAGILMAAGLLLFSGSLYALSLTGLRWLGAVTPIGGLAFLGAWLLFVIAIMRGA
ncbi:MAG: DUF423 domain-containing protein [Candidatus Competibacteraceae bacterium]|nr:DUF423 domain-containing protein [Candidatus Competibacteraceae bacterium]